MSTKFVKRVLTVAALGTLPLLQGCVGGEEDIIFLRNAWMPVSSGSAFGSAAATGQGAATGQQAGGGGGGTGAAGAVAGSIGGGGGYGGISTGSAF